MEFDKVRMSRYINRIGTDQPTCTLEQVHWFLKGRNKGCLIAQNTKKGTPTGFFFFFWKVICGYHVTPRSQHASKIDARWSTVGGAREYKLKY